MSYTVPAVSAVERQRSLLQQVYAWMAGGLGLTGFVAMWAYSSGFISNLLDQGRGLFIGLIIFEFILVIGLSAAMPRLSSAMATGGFLFYSALNGLTLSVIFLAYTRASIATTFFITAGMFAGMSVFGYVTKRDLSGVGNFLIMAFWGFFLASIVNIFVASSALYWVLTYAGVVIFTGLIAYDTQKIKQLGAQLDGQSNPTAFRRVVIMGALHLYLDFINLFLMLLRIFGDRR